MVRGEVFRLRSPRARVGREQDGARYGVVVQSDQFLGMSTALVAPTSTSARAATFRPVIDVGGTRTRVMVEQTMAVDIQRLGHSAGRLEVHEMQAIDKALRLLLEL